MYYMHHCSYCSRIFYTYNHSKEAASHVLYLGIKAHLVSYNEDHKEYEFDDGEEIDSDEVYAALIELSEAPAGGYELR